MVTDTQLYVYAGITCIGFLVCASAQIYVFAKAMIRREQLMQNILREQKARRTYLNREVL